MIFQDSIEWTYFLTDKKIQFWRLKLLGWLDSSFDSFRSIKPVFKLFSIPGLISPERLKIIFEKEIRGIWTFFFILLSPSSIPLLIPLSQIFFCLFLSQSFKGFSPKHLVRLFWPSFLFVLHAFMHFHQKISKFQTKRILGFLMILVILIQFVGWVFVHASYKHDSHALISKFSWFVQNFEIRVYMFLRNLGILFNWIKLSKISIYAIVWLSNYNMFYTCVVQLINIRIFEKLGFQNWGFC